MTEYAQENKNKLKQAISDVKVHNADKPDKAHGEKPKQE